METLQDTGERLFDVVSAHMRLTWYLVNKTLQAGQLNEGQLFPTEVATVCSLLTHPPSLARETDRPTIRPAGACDGFCTLDLVNSCVLHESDLSPFRDPKTPNTAPQTRCKATRCKLRGKSNDFFLSLQ